ncbi:MAG: hydrogenase maturation protease [Myxococcota bacterium]|nr:hydrogenase maturation protease [Myxococcota bacterium]
MGNEIRCDDAIGLTVLERVKHRLQNINNQQEITFLSLRTGGLDLIYELEGYDDLIVVDSYFSPSSKPGRVRILYEEDLIGALSVDSAHLISLPTALTLSKRLGYHTPRLICAVVIDVGEQCMVFGSSLTEEVAQAGNEAADRTCEIVREYLRVQACG